MERSIRVYFTNRIGYCRQNFNWADGRITSNSVVHISISEARLFDTGISTFTVPQQQLIRWLGGARMTVHNVSPHEGGVEFSFSVEWYYPLNIAIDITVFDPPVLTWDADRGHAL